MKKKIDFALMDSPSAYFWDIHSSGALKMIGDPIPSGIGFGIAVNKEETLLLHAINKALLIYLQSDDFKLHKSVYFDEF